MSKSFVNLGIDHGTTNSSIAMMSGTGPRVILLDGMHPIMPSAVYITRGGQNLIGSPACEAMLVNTAEDGDGHTGYKPLIGQDIKYDFFAAKKRLSPVELGGLVLNALLRAYSEETRSEIPKACVITVPANFTESACARTRQAAEKAGILYSPLLPEPRAAALAYGFSAKDTRAHWLVFDIGGGTLDISVVSVRNGKTEIAEGDDGIEYLGGRKFDRELMDYVLGELKKQYALDNFRESSKRYSQAWKMLCWRIEDAKITLSTDWEARIEIDHLCEDDDRKVVDVDMPITRELYESLIRSDVERAVVHCLHSIEKNALSPKDIDRLILIGGPSKTPLIQQMLKEALDKEPETSIDPMTAVAQGAAIYGATCELPPELIKRESTSGDLDLKIEYEASSRISLCPVCGVVRHSTIPTTDLSVEITRNDGMWKSGTIQLSPSGIFDAEVHLIESDTPVRSDFTTTVRDGLGNILATRPEPRIWHPYPDSGSGNGTPMPHSLRVGLIGNQTKCLIERNAPVPAKGDDIFYTTRALRRGHGDEELEIPVLEGVPNSFGGEDSRADCNVHVGSIVIRGDDERLTRDLPEGSTVEITVHVDESRQLHVEAYFPLLSESFDASFTASGYAVELPEVQKRFDALTKTFSEIQKLHRATPLPEVEEKLEILDRTNRLDGVRKELGRAEDNERGALEQSYFEVLKLAGELNVLLDSQRPIRFTRDVERLAELAIGSDVQILDGIKNEYGKMCQAGNGQDIGWLHDALEELKRRIYRPLNLLYLDVVSFPERFQGTREQIEAYDNAAALIREWLDMEQAGKEVTKGQIERARKAHEQLELLWPDLDGQRSRVLDEWDKRPPDDRVGWEDLRGTTGGPQG